MSRKGEKALLIINPISGGVDKKTVRRKVVSRLKAIGISTDTQYTRHKGHAMSLAGEAAVRGYGMVVVAGGDGTVNEVASALRHSGVPMAIIPCGSGNGLARHIGLPPDVDKALDVVEERHIIEADCGIANGLPFFCTCGMGFDAAVSEKFSTSKKRGPVSYIRSAVSEFIKYEPALYEIAIGEKIFRFKAFIVAVCNASQYGNNAFIAPRASIKDGLLDITVVHNGNPLVLASVGVDLFSGALDHNMFIQTFRVKDAVITATANAVHIDGEPLTMQGPVHISCDPGSFRLITPREKKPFRSYLTPVLYFFRDLVLYLTRPFRK